MRQFPYMAHRSIPTEMASFVRIMSRPPSARATIGIPIGYIDTPHDHPLCVCRVADAVAALWRLWRLPVAYATGHLPEPLGLLGSLDRLGAHGNVGVLPYTFTKLLIFLKTAK